MPQLSTVLDRVHDELPGVPEPVALRALSDSTKEFCKRTHIWQQDLSAVRTRAERTEFDLPTDPGVMIVALLEVRLATGELVPPYAGELTRLLTTPISSSAKPLGFVQRTPSKIEMVNATDTALALTITAALTLVQGQTDVELPQDLLDEYAEALGAGAKMRLVKQKGTPWFAPEDVVMYAGPFYRAVNEAKARLMTSMQEAQMRVQMRSWV